MSKMASPAVQEETSNSLPGSFRQSMVWLHTWTGLMLGWVLLFMFITGTAGYFDTEIDRWMQPELPPAQLDLPAENVVTVLMARLAMEAPEAKRWVISLPADRNSPFPYIFWQGAVTETGNSVEDGELLVDGITGELLEARDSGGGQLLYRMHWALRYLSSVQADLIVGLATLFMLVALITGVIIHKQIFKEFFTFRPGRGRRSWLDAHSVLGVLALPFFLLITYSGLILMAFSYMPVIAMAHYGKDAEARQQFVDDVFEPSGLVEPAGERAPLASLSGMIATAEKHWGTGRIRGIDIRHPGDRHAQIIFYEIVDGRIAGDGEPLIFDGVSGELLHSVVPFSSAKAVRELFIGLHEGLFAPPLLRWLYFLSGLMGYAMIATGLILWTIKRRTRSGATLGFRVTERLNIGTIAGLPVAIATYFWANRLLPVEIVGRAEWEVHVMFSTWAVMLIHAACRPVRQAWLEQFRLAAVLFGLLPVLNALTTSRHLGNSLLEGDWVFAGFDLTVLAIGLVLAGIVRKSAASTAWQSVTK